MPKESVRDQMNGEKNTLEKTAKICENMSDSQREAFKRLRSNVLLGLPEKQGQGGHILGVTSAQTAEGKSTVAINLAYTLLELGKSVLLVDCDMRCPDLHNSLGAKQTPGLSDVLQDGVDTAAAVVTYKATKDGIHFDLLPGGSVSDRSPELLSSARFQSLLETLSASYDYVLLDLPPVGPVTDAVEASKFTEGLLVVVRENHCPRFALDDCMEQLRYAKAKVLGFVLNGCEEDHRHRCNQKYKNQA